MSIATWGRMSPGGDGRTWIKRKGELVARDAQRCSVSLREVTKGEPAEIVRDAVFGSRDDGHEGGGIGSRHA